MGCPNEKRQAGGLRSGLANSDASLAECLDSSEVVNFPPEIAYAKNQRQRELTGPLNPPMVRWQEVP